ncbi:DUF4286 family protein [Hoyosella rhizosphaerae]|nr:DUF4286 family protein [Hoyosella rhizosphaerae]
MAIHMSHTRLAATPPTQPKGLRTHLSGVPAPTVTTSVVRDVDAEREEDFVQWTEAGISLARTFPGFLGAGWVRSSTNKHRYHVQYRFSDDRALQSWLQSPLRGAWFAHGRLFSKEAAVHQRTGIEGWFDPMMSAVPAESQQPTKAPLAPPRWKQAVTIWLGFFPVSLLMNFLFLPYLADVNVVLTTLIVTVAVTPVMVFAVLPFVTARLAPWLQRKE